MFWGFFNSVAILQYLVAVLPDVPDHWYPVDPKTRAKVNEYMMCHHANGLRSNGVFNPYVSLETLMWFLYQKEKFQNIFNIISSGYHDVNHVQTFNFNVFLKKF